MAGIPLPDEMVESLRRLGQGRARPHRRGRRARNTRSIPGCDAAEGRARRAPPRWQVPLAGLRPPHCLQVHHLWPVSWGGGDEQSNLALVCVGGGTDHHGHLAPTGKYLLLGNPNCPDGLHLVRVDQLAELAELAADQARARPVAA